MSEQKKYWLINDVVSHFAPYPIYGSAGTEVVILHDHLDMMIVQDKQGNIFHSRTDNLTIEKLISGSVVPIEIELALSTKELLNRKKKSSSINQTNLF